MPDPALIASAVQQTAGGALKSGVGLLQYLKGRKLLKGLQYPTEQLPDEYQQNQNLAQTMASTGMPSEQYAMAMKNIQRQQVMALRAANDRRGGLNVLPQILQGTNDATLKLDANSAAMRTANQRTLMGVNSQIGNIRRDLYDKNIRQKYIRDYNYAMGLKGMGGSNLLGGLDQRIGAAGLLGGTVYGQGGGNGYNGMSENDFLKD